MADFWNDLVNTALLGTDKQTFDENLLPETIKNSLSQVDKKDKEALFYKAAALASFFKKAGNMPEKLEVTAGLPAETEVLSYAPTPVISLLRKIFSYDSGNYALVEKWLDEAIRKSWIITPDLLLVILNLGLDKKYKHLQPKIRQIAGKRGLWMTQFNSEWNYLKETDYLLLWEEGKAAERKIALEEIRKNNPAQARELLEKSWEQETAKTKLELIAVLKNQLSSDDEPFLQQVFDEIQTVRQKKKDATPDLLKQVVELLLSLPESKLSQEIWEKVKRYVYKTKDKKLLGLVSAENIAVVIPEKGDDFLCKETMWERLGILEESHNKNVYVDVEGWLYEIISRISPQLWEQHLSASPVQIMEAFNKGDGFTKKKDKAKEDTIALYTVALAQAAYYHNNTTWARSWLEYYKDVYTIQQTHVSYLLGYLSDAELEEFYLKHIDLSNTATDSQRLREELLKRKEHQWSFAFTQYVVKAMCSDLTSYNYGNTVSFLIESILHMHPDIVKENISDYMSANAPGWVRSQYDKTIVFPLQEMMGLRMELKKVFEG
ncbi:DUF5691 domain-containing protein [Cytophagaceae bacterium YF14B1]|uniref:DUF5691 domain-containing protein n=1 Tax=Xanthocytophaga flava TaxID=3048013 RepID=A0AAE3UA51_9BACT|nr:DUF5691 domain-containing protein [Xanthocytophaga flavus]MDJ1482419.1 DUF5691 domain-containing protein [Xanthocytophaga flavus]